MKKVFVVYKLDAKYYVTKADSIDIEKTLLHNKNMLFSLLFEQSKIQTYRQKNIQIRDTLQDRSNYYYSYFDLHLTTDKNKNKLIRKWLDKEEFEIRWTTDENPDGSLDLARSLEFYNSEDMAVYLDSLKQNYYKNRFESRYKNNFDKSAVVPYIPRNKFK